jgi:hypothetical protein
MINQVATRRLAIAVLFVLVVFSGSLYADTVKFPKDSPAMSIELPAGWKAEFIDGKSMPGGDRLQLMSEAGTADLSIKVLPADANITDEESAKSSLQKVAMEDMKSMEASKVGDVEETTVAGHKAFGAKVTTGIGQMFYAIFTPDGKTYFSMFSMQGGADAVVKAIKADEAE